MLNRHRPRSSPQVPATLMGHGRQRQLVESSAEAPAARCYLASRARLPQHGPVGSDRSDILLHQIGGSLGKLDAHASAVAGVGCSDEHALLR